MPDFIDDAIINAFYDLHRDLPRQGPGSDATTRRLLTLAGPLPDRPRALDLGCGPGRAALLLAAVAGAQVTAVDTHQPYLDQLRQSAVQRRLEHVIRAVNVSMAELPYPDHSFDLIWAEGSVYHLGFDHALRVWRRLLAPGGVLVVTECEWTTPDPAPDLRAYWDQSYPLRSTEQNLAAAKAAGYEPSGLYRLPDGDWFEEYYDLLEARVAAADPSVPGMAQAIAATRQEIDLRRRYAADYAYTGHVLRTTATTTSPMTRDENTMTHTWITRAETPQDIPAIRTVALGAFPTPLEADLIEALRVDPAWSPELSIVAQAPDGTVAGYALLTRCHVGAAPALALGPCAVLPQYQKTGAGSAAIRAGLQAARDKGENLVLVLGHPEYYPRFGFTPASAYGIRPSFEVPDEAMMALVFDDAIAVPSGTIVYPAPFGV